MGAALVDFDAQILMESQKIGKWKPLSQNSLQLIEKTLEDVLVSRM